ncbi:BrnT family toxin [bacterium]|nr:BrnT family toxin [bacterium]MCI0614884.1 BrnT family toxin [bacterium]
MEIVEFQWDEMNVEHIVRHNVSPDEIENVAFDDEPWIEKGRTGTRYMLGYTAAGRYLFVIYVLKAKGLARVMTAIDMDEKTRRLYKKRGKW